VGEPFLVALEQADGLRHLENAANFGDGGDPFPGSSGKLNFSSATNPESGSYSANPCPSNSCIAVANIQTALLPTILADLRVMCMAAAPCLNILSQNQAAGGRQAVA
jgi:immune inhibitor A